MTHSWHSSAYFKGANSKHTPELGPGCKHLDSGMAAALANGGARLRVALSDEGRPSAIYCFAGSANDGK
jgi:hypothetical protein